jgi:hypothetical protein
MKTNILVKRLALSVLGIFIFLSSFSQQNYLPGNIIQLNGDTLQGFIDYRKWLLNPDEIHFREQSESNELPFTPQDIKGFTVSGEIYESAFIKVETSLKEISVTNELTFESDTVFLQVLFKGAKCLYFYDNKTVNEQFYIKQDSSYELLIYKKYMKKQNAKNLLMENKRYIGQLLNYLKDCPSIQSILNKTEYTKNSLEKLFTNYYELTQSDIQFQKKIEKISTEFGVLAGVSNTTMEFSGSYTLYSPLTLTDYSTSTNFTTGVFFEVIFRKNQKKWSINNEIVYTSFKVDGSLDFYPMSRPTSAYSEIGYSYLKLNNMLRYKYPVGNFFVYANVGFFNGLALKETTNYLKEVVDFNSTVTTTEGILLQERDIRKIDQGYILGLGAKSKKLSFEVRYEKGLGISGGLGPPSLTKIYHLLLGYRF